MATTGGLERLGFKHAVWAVPACLLLALSSAGVSIDPAPDDDRLQSGPQITVLAIEASRGAKTSDAKLDAIKARLEKLRPGYGFALLDARSRPVIAGTSGLKAQLSNGCTLKLVVIESADEHGKYQIRCELDIKGQEPRVTEVRAPLNQIFFIEYPLDEGKRLLVGIGAR